MNPTAKSIDELTWRRVLGSLGEQLGKAEIDRWLSDVQLLSIQEDVATLSVPSRLHQEWIVARYEEAIRAELSVSQCQFELHEVDLGQILEDPSDATFAQNTQTAPTQAPESSAPKTQAPPLAEPAAVLPLVLKPDYTFDCFVVGPCNRFAYAAARGVADRPAIAFNPLFLHGSVGLGKTHLMQAIAHRLLDDEPNLNIVFLSCEQFVNHFIQALQAGDINSFRQRYRAADVLIVDDIQLLANKTRTQEEFFHTFNELHNAGKQIVLSSDSPPQDIPSLQERLVSRFKWGLVAEIEPPCFETRVAILKQKADVAGIELPQDVAALVAENVPNNVRELEGTLTRIRAMASLTNRPIDFGLAREILASSSQIRARSIRIDDILGTVCRHFSSSVSEIQSKKRTQSVVFPRQVAMFLARRLTELSLGEIGGYFGGRDHSTVVYALEKIEARRRVESEFSLLLGELERRVREDIEGK
ncbi:MAG: chromosomal replication initiator protein DnaA [Planctomycetota bacterium]|nr:chromosomal replication initiator protein DnaA [Planctomycetota bacterium]